MSFTWWKELWKQPRAQRSCAFGLTKNDGSVCQICPSSDYQSLNGYGETDRLIDYMSHIWRTHQVPSLSTWILPVSLKFYTEDEHQNRILHNDKCNHPILCIPIIISGVTNEDGWGLCVSFNRWRCPARISLWSRGVLLAAMFVQFQESIPVPVRKSRICQVQQCCKLMVWKYRILDVHYIDIRGTDSPILDECLTSTSHANQYGFIINVSSWGCPEK